MYLSYSSFNHPFISYTKCISINTQCIRHCFTLQSLLATDQRTRLYTNDPYTKLLLDCLSISTPLDEPTIIHLPKTYRIAIVRNILGTLEDRLVYYEPIATITNHIFCIIIQTPLCRIIFNLVHATSVAEHMEIIKLFTVLKLDFSGLDCDLMFLTGSSNVPIVCSLIVGIEEDKN